MSGLIGKCVRRVHIPPGMTGKRIRCPDCRSMLARVGEVKDGEVSVQLLCTHCRDAERNRKIFVIIFHASAQSYTETVKKESLLVDSHV